MKTRTKKDKETRKGNGKQTQKETYTRGKKNTPTNKQLKMQKGKYTHNIKQDNENRK